MMRALVPSAMYDSARVARRPSAGVSFRVRGCIMQTSMTAVQCMCGRHIIHVEPRHLPQATRTGVVCDRYCRDRYELVGIAPDRPSGRPRKDAT